ncbi:hypothetical protein [Stakelama saccharophila]|uniref:Uncharacterized protein n=1 Tax=Stakelama saccharophila TaxID=3075605 RepID=A0ABZ0BAI6_9SPHN|nr:hypothetical protein [Stakelama sp. W311]WNO54289.1 hypothetical protein RPR59_03230 [Stakelama sp. W311]
MQSNDRIYFLKRASRERELAELCRDDAVATAHRQMAKQYERRADGLSQEQTTIVERN